MEAGLKSHYSKKQQKEKPATNFKWDSNVITPGTEFMH